ncbi:hypothetical protein LQ356_00820 [Metamycoplasma faucium]|uniref:Uncharacterized protein n=1 Tax=Metamycoplasma faucium TaxID=56142 RepID=A0ABZ2TNM0_9BACT
MSTLSLFESNESLGQISLSRIFNNEQDNYFFESEKDLKLVEAIIKVYARNVSSMVSNNTIKKDIESISNIKVSEEKIRQLVNKLIDLFIIDEVKL